MGKSPINSAIWRDWYRIQARSLGISVARLTVAIDDARASAGDPRRGLTGEYHRHRPHLDTAWDVGKAMRTLQRQAGLPHPTGAMVAILAAGYYSTIAALIAIVFANPHSSMTDYRNALEFVVPDMKGTFAGGKLALGANYGTVLLQQLFTESLYISDESTFDRAFELWRDEQSGTNVPAAFRPAYLSLENGDIVEGLNALAQATQRAYFETGSNAANELQGEFEDLPESFFDEIPT
jgi:hypothetical protein